MQLNQIKILEKIQNALSTGNAFSIHELSKKTGLHYVTVKKYIKLIEIMKKMPEIEIIKSNSTTLIRMEIREGVFSR